MQETIDIDRDGNPLTYEDIMATEDTIADDIAQKIRSTQVRALIGTVLSTRERQVLLLRYGLGCAPPATQKRCASLLGISRSYVSRIEKAALEKLRLHMR